MPQRVYPWSPGLRIWSMESVKRLYRDAQPDVVIHLAARVGGIGANGVIPESFSTTIFVMGTQLMDQARLCGVKKFVAIGTVCSYPKFTQFHFARKPSGMGIQKKPMRHTDF